MVPSINSAVPGNRIQDGFDIAVRSETGIVAAAVRAQLRLSHDLLGQGETSPVKSIDLKKETFQVSIELPPERFLKPWNEVKLVSHLSLYLRQIKQNPDPITRSNELTVARLTIDTLELETLRRQDCPVMEPRQSQQN